ncbi:hypothetical protein PG990_000002 [Apiospora arundinis]
MFVLTFVKKPQLFRRPAADLTARLQHLLALHPRVVSWSSISLEKSLLFRTRVGQLPWSYLELPRSTWSYPRAADSPIRGNANPKINSAAVGPNAEAVLQVAVLSKARTYPCHSQAFDPDDGKSCGTSMSIVFHAISKHNAASNSSVAGML